MWGAFRKGRMQDVRTVEGLRWLKPLDSLLKCIKSLLVNIGMELFFLGKYKREDAENALLEIGFCKKEYEIFGSKTFRYEKPGFVVHLTSEAEGKIQVQGNAPEDIMEKGRTSKFYKQFEAIVKAISPERIVDGGFNEYFTELLTD
jgi:hypothetical protein